MVQATAPLLQGHIEIKKAAMTQTSPERCDGRLGPTKAPLVDTSKRLNFTAGLLTGLAQEADGKIPYQAL